MPVNSVASELREHSAYPLILVLACIFIINPPAGLFAAFLYVLTSARSHDHLFRIASWHFVAIGIFLGAVNSTKIPENDLVWYYRGYLDAGRYSYSTYIEQFGINGQGKELFFPTFNYILYQIFGPSTKAYITIVTTIYYGSIGLATSRVARALKIHPAIAMVAMTVFAAAPNIFSLSALLLRQNIAFAIVMVVMTDRFIYGKNRYILMILAVLTHASSLFFLLIFFVPGIRQRITAKTLPVFSAITALILNYQAISALIVSAIPGDNVLTYALTRASTGTNYELNALSMTQISFNLAMLAGMFCAIYIFKPSYKNNSGVIAISNVVFITLLFVISNLEYTELSSRFNFYYLSLFPIAATIALSTVPMRIAAPVLIVSQPLLLALFVAGLYWSVWSYELKQEILYWPVFLYYL